MTKKDVLSIAFKEEVMATKKKTEKRELCSYCGRELPEEDTIPL